MVVQKRKIGIILQARMGSTRLPGKVLKPLAGKPMIQWIIERLQICKNADVLILASSTLDENQPLLDLMPAPGRHPRQAGVDADSIPPQILARGLTFDDYR